MAKLHRAIVKSSEYGLYALLLGQPTTGLLMKLLSGRSFALFTWRVPPLLVRDEALQAAFNFSHEAGAWVLGALAVGHAAAALFHHFVLRDDVLATMAPVIATASKQGLETGITLQPGNKCGPPTVLVTRRAGSDPSA
jgi:cytochrome b561